MTATQMTSELKRKDSFFTMYNYDEFVDICQIERDQIEGRKRDREIVLHRSIAHVLGYIEKGSLKASGELTGHDHATVIHSIRNVYNGLSINDKLYMDIITKFAQDVQSYYLSGTNKLTSALSTLENQFNKQTNNK